MAKDFTYTVHEELLNLGTSSSGWDKLLTLISWGDGEPTYDIRSWNGDRTRCGKGITLSLAELKILLESDFYELTGEEKDGETDDELEYEDEELEYEDDSLYE